MNASLRVLLAPCAAAALAVGLVACGDDDDDGGGSVEITEVWVRQPAEGQPNAAGYASITNTGDDEVTLVGASAPVTATFEIHETLMNEDGTMGMQEKAGGFAIAAGETLVLEPGGPHVMMLGVDPAEFTGDLDLTFVFDGVDPVTEVAELRVISGDAMGDMDMDDMEHDDGEMDDMEGGGEADPMDGDDMSPQDTDG